MHYKVVCVCVCVNPAEGIPILLSYNGVSPFKINMHTQIETIDYGRMFYNKNTHCAFPI